MLWTELIKQGIDGEGLRQKNLDFSNFGANWKVGRNDRRCCEKVAGEKK